MCLVICVGLAVAIAAGVAYGYNYSMSEFLTFKRSDVAVYMRRSRFYDNPNMDFHFSPKARRRSSGDKNIAHLSELESTETPESDREMTSDRRRAEDARSYIEKLKFTPASTSIKLPTLPPGYEVTRAPSVVLPPSELAMRNYYPRIIFRGSHKSDAKKEKDFEYVNAVERATLPPMHRGTGYLLPIDTKTLPDLDDDNDYNTELYKPV